MECDGSDSRPLSAVCASPRPVVKKMEWEEEKKKSGSKKKRKPIQTGFDSDDDEPIGSLFNFKSIRNPNKIRMELDGVTNKDKDIEVCTEELVVTNEDFGSMDVTLASFRKKLKDNGSGINGGRSFSIDVGESSGQSMNGHVKDGGLAMETEVMEKGQLISGDGSDWNIDEESENWGKKKVKRSKCASKMKKTKCDTGLNDALDGWGSRDCSIQNQKESVLGPGKGSNFCLEDNNLEHSLSSFLQEAHSRPIRNSQRDLRLKHGRVTQSPKNGFSYDDVSEDNLSVVVSSSQPASNLVRTQCGDALQLASGRIPIDSIHSLNKIGMHQTSDEKLQEKPLSGDALRELSSSPVTTDLNIRSSDSSHGGSPEAILEDSTPISLQRSMSCLSAYTNRTTTIKRGEVDGPTGGILEVPQLNCCDADHLHDRDPDEFLSYEMKDYCPPPSQEPTSEFQNFKGRSRVIDLAHDIVMSNLISDPVQMEEIHHFDMGMSNVGFNDAVDEQSQGISTMHPASMDQKISYLSRKGGQEACSDDESLNRVYQDTSQKTFKQLPGKILEGSAKSSMEDSSPCSEKMTAASKIKVDLDCYPSGKNVHSAQIQLSCPVLGMPKKEETSSNRDGLDQVPATCIVERGLPSVSSQKEDSIVSKSRSSPPKFHKVHKSEFAIQMKHQGKSQENADTSRCLSPELCLNESVASIHGYCCCAHQSQPSNNVPKGICVSNHDYLPGSREARGASSPSITLDRNESYAEGKGHLSGPKFKDKKPSAIQCAVRKTKKRRQRDMTYQGDSDWEILIREKDFLESPLIREVDQSLRAREKCNSKSFREAEIGGAAAVSVGLKAHAAASVEKIKFKELLKRKGGLQEYLLCRNEILGLWGKYVSHILPLLDCGVTATPSADEPPRASLVREIYAFLDRNGYINVGIASEKEKVEPSATHNFKILEDKNTGEKVETSDTDADDGVSFMLGRFRSHENSMGARNGDILNDQKQTAEATKDESRACAWHKNSSIVSKSPNRTVNVDLMTSNPSCKLLESKAVPVITSARKKHLHGVQSASSDGMRGNHSLQCDSEIGKRIIVIGAGPAGLTAARHLQRQGFFVTVLEARSRIGGRVYTDRSSLSVPVDLGASIITGVEADVATERRPDPSSLVCAQLGLELTVLNSDCPLYDIVTGQKVPAELDEALEAEYNSLLDDMAMLVAHKGEQAMKMSLEDGFEYALKRRRTAQLGKNYVESELLNFVDSEKTSMDGKASENKCSTEEILSPPERRVMDWHFAHLEYGCAASLGEVSLPFWNQDDDYGGFGGAHCMIKGGYSTVVESLGEGLFIHLNHVVTDISYCSKHCSENDDPGNKVKVSTSNGGVFSGEAVLITVPLGCLKAEAIKFSPPLPSWKRFSIQQLGFGVLDKVVLEFPEVFWDDSVDYFGATAEETNQRGHCFMFWNVKKTVGAPVLVALVVGKAAIDGQNTCLSDHVTHSLTVLRKLFGEAAVPDPVASVVTDWGKDPFSYGAYSYVALGASGEDYDILGKPVENCLFFAGEATCKEHPDTVGGAMMSGLREAVRMMDILITGNDCTAEVEAMEAAHGHSDNGRNEVWDVVKRLEAVELSNVLYNDYLDGTQIFTREALLQDMFSNAKTTAGRLHLAKELLNLPIEALKFFAGTKEGLSTLNSWILDSMGKDGTQLLRHCVRLLVLVSTDLLAVRLSGIGKTIKEKVCVHSSRDIRAIASQLVNVWIEVFRKEKASNGGLKLLRQPTVSDSSNNNSLASGKPHLPPSVNTKRVNVKPAKLETRSDSKLEVLSNSQGYVGQEEAKGEECNFVMSKEEQAAFAAAEAARAAALAAAEAYASSEAKCNTSLPLPKIPSFHKFARREQYAQMDESDINRKWSGGALGRQDCISEIDSRNCRVRDWSVDFSAACMNLESSKMLADNLSQRSHSNEIASQLNIRDHSAVNSSILTKAWVDGGEGVGIKDYNAIDRWQSQAAASDFFHLTGQISDEEDLNMNPKLPSWGHEQLADGNSVSPVTVRKELVGNQPRGTECIKQAVVEHVASLLMPLYKAKKIEKEGYKSIMKKTATKVMDQATDAEKAMTIDGFLDSKRKNKIRAFVDKLIERHLAMKPVVKP